MIGRAKVSQVVGRRALALAAVVLLNAFGAAALAAGEGDVPAGGGAGAVETVVADVRGGTAGAEARVFGNTGVPVNGGPPVREITLPEVLDRALRASTGAELVEIQHAAALLSAQETAAAVRPQLDLQFQGLQSKYDLDWEQTCWRLEDLSGNPIEDSDGTPIEFCFPPDDFDGTFSVRQGTATISLRTPLIPTPEVRATRTLVDAAIDAAAAQRDAALGDIALEVTRLYYGLLKAERAVELAELAFEEATVALDEARKRELDGTGTTAKRLEAEAVWYEAQAALIQAQGARDRARIALNQITGLPLTQAVRPHRPLVYVEEPPALDMALDAALARPDIRQAVAELAQAQAYHTLARRELGPGFQVFGQLQKDDFEATIGLDRTGFMQLSFSGTAQKIEEEEFEQDGYSWSVGFNVQIPLRDAGARQARVGQAAYGVQAAEKQLEYLLTGLQGELMGLEAEWTASVQVLRAAEEALAGRRALAESIAELSARGAASSRELLQAQLGVLEAELRLLEAEERYMLTRAEYLQTAGLWLNEVYAWLGKTAPSSPIPPGLR